MPRKAILVILAGIALLLGAGVLVAALFTVPIPLSQERVSDFLRKHYFTYDVEFSAARIGWRPRTGALNLYLDDVKLREPGRDTVATVPGITMSVDAAVLIGRRTVLRGVTLTGPTVRVVKTAGGALKVDIGPSDEGLSGSLVMTLLTDIAAARPPTGGDAPETTLNLVDASLHLADEATGVRIRLAPWHAQIRGAPDGVRTSTQFRTEAAGEAIAADLDIRFDTASYGFALTGTFGNLTPAVLSRRFPNLSVLQPLEIPLNGEIVAKLDRFLAIEHADIAVQGQAGSLELARIIGKNLETTDLKARLVIEDGGKVFRISDMTLGMPGATLQGQARGRVFGDKLRLAGTLGLSGAHWSDVAPLWFASLAPLTGAAGGNGAEPLLWQNLDFAIVADSGSGGVRGSGDLRAATAHPADDADVAKTIELTLTGNLAFPELRFHVQP